ncbi:MAG TPA: dephospho-CoA kinase [Pyrinomonadaceae bacterium]|jgi:dephospho-CoA kinase|nr:dephospho-CoA kinase [Pyrinomonadaceae bacterium]
MLRVGLTGSIAVGKSFVSGVLAELGCRLLDADATAREVVEPGSAALRSIVTAFGPDILRADSTLDRAKLGAVVFADADQRARLNSILHPYIIARQDERLREWETTDPNGIAVVDAALMIESGGYKRFDKLIVVHCRDDVQLQRVMVRNNLHSEEAQRRIAAQMPQDEKKKFADYLIDTSAGFDAARQRATEVYEELRADGERKASSTASISEVSE